MDPETVGQLLELLDALTTIGLLGLIVWSLISEKVVPKGRLDDQKELTKQATDGWLLQTKNNERLADLWEARNEAEERARASK